MMQQKGIVNLLGLNYTIQYKKGVENNVADALSRREYEIQHQNEVTSMAAVTLSHLLE